MQWFVLSHQEAVPQENLRVLFFPWTCMNCFKVTHEEKVLIGNRRKKYESGGGHAEPLPGLAPLTEHRLCNLSTEKLLFAPALWWPGPHPNTEFGTRWDWWSHLIHDLAVLHGSKSHLRHFVSMLLVFNSETRHSWKKAVWAVGIALCYEGLLGWKVRGSPAQQSSHGVHGPSPPEGPIQQRASCLTCISTWWWDQSPSSLAGPLAPCYKRPGTEHQHPSHASLLSWCHGTQELQHPADTSDKPTDGTRLHWFVPAPLALTHFWLKACAAPLGRRMTSHFLAHLNPSNMQPGYG